MGGVRCVGDGGFVQAGMFVRGKGQVHLLPADGEPCICLQYHDPPILHCIFPPPPNNPPHHPPFPRLASDPCRDLSGPLPLLPTALPASESESSSVRVRKEAVGSMYLWGGGERWRARVA